jgi:hypothetical protein
VNSTTAGQHEAGPTACQQPPVGVFVTRRLSAKFASRSGGCDAADERRQGYSSELDGTSDPNLVIDLKVC